MNNTSTTMWYDLSSSFNFLEFHHRGSFGGLSLKGFLIEGRWGVADKKTIPLGYRGIDN